MKKKILSLLAAFFMLFGTSAMAQVDSTLEGDVNEDGVVDIADITAVIAIIKQNAEANPTYYWYVGQENPAEMTSISPIVTDNTSPGWRSLGSDLTVYNKDNMIFEGAVKHTITFSGRATAYIALPSSSIKLYDDTGYGEVLEDGWLNNPVVEKVINGVKYYIYTSNSSKLVAWGQDVY